MPGSNTNRAGDVLSYEWNKPGVAGTHEHCSSEQDRVLMSVPIIDVYDKNRSGSYTNRWWSLPAAIIPGRGNVFVAHTRSHKFRKNELEN